MKDEVRMALHNCGYPDWDLKEGRLMGKKQVRKGEEMGQHQGQEGEKRQLKAYMQC